MYILYIYIYIYIYIGYTYIYMINIYLKITALLLVFLDEIQVYMHIMFNLKKSKLKVLTLLHA